MNVKGDAVAPGAAPAATFPKMGLNVAVVAEEAAVEGGTEPVAAATAREVPAAESAPLSLFGRVPKIGLNMGVAAGAVDAAAGPGWLAGGVLSIPKRMLGLGGEDVLVGVWPRSEEAGSASLLTPLAG